MTAMNRIALVTAVSLAACGGPKPLTDKEQQALIVTSMHDSLLSEIQTLKAAATELHDAAPTPTGRGWDATMDAAAITAMKTAWYKARSAYERVEGALAPIFPDLDIAIDQRYDGFLVTLGTAGDPDPFDGMGATGMHSIERVLWADSIPPGVVRVESTLPGYKAAAFPATEAEAKDFKDKLVAQLITDVTTLETQWTPAKIDLPGAYTGLKDLMNEQREKVNKAGDNLEESRYSQRTMKDLRDNLDGTKTIYAMFEPWLVTKKTADGDGSTLDGQIKTGFDAVSAAYAKVTGDAIPAPPSTWSAESPSAADLMTDFGKLYSQVRDATDPTKDGSVTFEMGKAGVLMGFPSGQ
jgi:iron uptake system component EfeO